MQAGSATDLLFATLDQEGDNRVSEAEFMSLVTVLKVNWEEEEVATYCERVWPRLYHSSAFQWVRRVVLSSWFQYGARLRAIFRVSGSMGRKGGTRIEGHVQAATSRCCSWWWRRCGRH